MWQLLPRVALSPVRSYSFSSKQAVREALSVSFDGHLNPGFSQASSPASLSPKIINERHTCWLRVQACRVQVGCLASLRGSGAWLRTVRIIRRASLRQKVDVSQPAIEVLP